jgi:hypothetical protein
VDCDDTEARFAISNHGQPTPEYIEMCLTTLWESWNPGKLRQPPELGLYKKKKKGLKKSLVTTHQVRTDSKPAAELATHLSKLIDLRVNHVRLWLDLNLRRFQRGHAAIEDLRRKFDSLVIELKDNVQLCRAQCASCHLLCILSRLHGGDHSCQTSHKCIYTCRFCIDSTNFCGLAWVLCFS